MRAKGPESELRAAGLSPEAVRRVLWWLAQTKPIEMARAVLAGRPEQELRLRADRDRFLKALDTMCCSLETMLGTLSLAPNRSVHPSARLWFMRRHVLTEDEERDFGHMLARARAKLSALQERDVERRPRNEVRRFMAGSAARALGHAGVTLDLAQRGAWYRLTAWMVAQIEAQPPHGFRLHRVLEAVARPAARDGHPTASRPVIKVQSRRH